MTTHFTQGAGVTDEAGRVARDTAVLFAAMRRLTAPEITELLAGLGAAADDLEVEMMGGEPADCGRDTGRGYYGRTVR